MDKIQALYDAKILNNKSKEAVTRVFVNNEDVAAVAASLAPKPRAPAAPRPAQAAPAPAAAAAAPAAPKAPRAPKPHTPHTGEPSKTTLFVANLPFAVDDAGLREIFDGQKVKEARVAVRRDGRSRGYGFVTFENEADMMAALKVVDKSSVENREISVRVVLGEMNERKPLPAGAAAAPAAPRQRRAPREDVPAGEGSKTVAFVGNLPFSVDDAALLKIFSAYAVKEAHVSTRANERSKGYALVTFETEADQEKAIAALNGTEIEGRQIHVQPSTKGSRPAAPAAASGAPAAPRQPRAPRARREPTGEASKLALFVANLPFVVDDSGLHQIFEGFQVTDAHVATRANGKSCGFGFVTLATEAEAQRALSVVDKSIVEGREIAVRPAHSAKPAGAAPAESKQ